MMKAWMNSTCCFLSCNLFLQQRYKYVMASWHVVLEVRGGNFHISNLAIPALPPGEHLWLFSELWVPVGAGSGQYGTQHAPSLHWPWFTDCLNCIHLPTNFRPFSGIMFSGNKPFLLLKGRKYHPRVSSFINTVRHNYKYMYLTSIKISRQPK